LFRGQSVGAPLFDIKGGANKSKGYLREEFIIRGQRKKKKRCISANQEKGFFLYLEGGGIW
jgi:hypothetical protein